MDKILALCLALLVVVAIAGFALVYHGNRTPVNTTRENETQSPGAQYAAATSINFSAGNAYLDLPNGTPSRIFLAGSSATFGTFTEDHVDPTFPGHDYVEASKGDRFVSINGTIRNDYDQRLDIVLDAHVYDRNGNQIGTLLRSSGRPEFKAAWMGLRAGDSGSFSLLMKLDKQYTAADIGRYEIVLAWEPSATPIP
jgi:hypothetical protein